MISVVIPYYEMHAYIDECLQSVEADGFPSKEIILVDDGSRSEEALAKLESLRGAAGRANGLRLLSKPNGGLGSARNHGIRHARGDLVLLLDADDRIVPGYLQAAMTALERCPELVFISCLSSLFADGRSPESARDWIVPYDPDLSMLFYENGAGTAASVFRREILEQFPFREDLPAYEDWDLYLRLSAAGLRGEVLPRVFHRYRQRPNGLSRLGHRNHDKLVEMILRPHLQETPLGISGALGIYLSSVTRLRGLGPRVGSGLMPSGVIHAMESFYRRWLKAWLSRNLGDERRDRIVSYVRRFL